jgi:uncharacterized protein YfiM (DUF2279 family)
MRFLKNRIFICCVLLLILISVSNKNVLALSDKLKHFAVSSIFGAASETCLHYKTDLKTSGRIILGTTLGSLPGLAKEIVDSTKEGNHFSGGDLAAGVAGAFLGAVVGNLINNKIQIKLDKSKEKKSVSVSFSFNF